MAKPYVTSSSDNIEILDYKVNEHKYGLRGEIIFRMLHNQKLFHVVSVHIDENTFLKNVGIIITRLGKPPKKEYDIKNYN